MSGSRASRITPGLAAATGPTSRLQARLDGAPDRELALRRRRRRVATGVLWVLGTAAFLGLYALSWVVVLDLS